MYLTNFSTKLRLSIIGVPYKLYVTSTECVHQWGREDPARARAAAEYGVLVVAATPALVAGEVAAVAGPIPGAAVVAAAALPLVVGVEAAAGSLEAEEVPRRGYLYILNTFVLLLTLMKKYIKMLLLTNY